MILHDVPDRACVVVESAATLYPEIFRHCDLHTLHKMAVPNWFEKGIRKAKIEDILNGILAEEVIDATYVFFGEGGVDDLGQGVS